MFFFETQTLVMVWCSVGRQPVQGAVPKEKTFAKMFRATKQSSPVLLLYFWLQLLHLRFVFIPTRRDETFTVCFQNSNYSNYLNSNVLAFTGIQRCNHLHDTSKLISHRLFTGTRRSNNNLCNNLCGTSNKSTSKCSTKFTTIQFVHGASKSTSTESMDSRSRSAGIHSECPISSTPHKVYNENMFGIHPTV